MKIQAERLDITYDAVFVQPAFDLPQKIHGLAKSVYDGLKPRFPLDMADFQGLPGTTLGDLGLKVTMFGGQGRWNHSSALSISLKDWRGVDCWILFRPKSSLWRFSALRRRS